jgi:RHS repeat-associated protein
MRTTYNGGVEGGYASLPFGDGQATTGIDTDANHYATLDHDTATDTDYAQYRQYANTQGRWLSPDPYDGSYDTSNPQSMNRYVYALNNPLSLIDPSGLDCTTDTEVPCGPPNTIYYQDQNGNIYYWDGTNLWQYNRQSVNVSANPGSCDMSSGAACIMAVTQLLNQLAIPASNPVAPNNGYVSNYPSYKSFFCTGEALQAKGASVALDVVGAIPGLGNTVSVTTGIAGAAVSVAGNATGAGISSASLGLAFADISLGGTKAIPIVGNILSGACQRV